MDDRDYYFIIKTFSAPGVAPVDFVATIQQDLFASGYGWRCDQEVAEVGLYHRIGDVDLQTGKEPVRYWNYCLVAELDACAIPCSRIDHAAASRERLELSAQGIECLSDEIMVRPAGAGTATPRPSPLLDEFPKEFTAAIEYIYIPREHWTDYKIFMRDVFGPIGQRLVMLGHSYKTIISEHFCSLHRDPSLPQWNRLHILTGDFDSEAGGFLQNVEEAVKELLGPKHSLETALAPASLYRDKPCMSKNRLVYTEIVRERRGD